MDDYINKQVLDDCMLGSMACKALLSVATCGSLGSTNDSTRGLRHDAFAVCHHGAIDIAADQVGGRRSSSQLPVRVYTNRSASPPSAPTSPAPVPSPSRAFSAGGSVRCHS